MYNSLFLFIITFFIWLASPALGEAQIVSSQAVLSETMTIVDEAHLAKDQEWLNLLHFRPNIFGALRSQASREEFFLAPTGYRDSHAELLATLKGLSEPAEKYKPDEHPMCRYPARKRWLQNHLHLPESFFAKANCPMYLSFVRRLDAKTISVVFSSYYSESPGSAFGHTLFRVSKNGRGDETHNELLDFGIGFAADANSEVNALVFAVGGLLGGFTGSFANVPYYYKVREYSAAESRDLWSYELNLSPDEVSNFVDHIWEVGQTHFHYYFFTQNCGLHILTVLDAAVPRLHLVDRVPLWVIPVDAVRAVGAEPELVKGIHFRPSLKTLTRVQFSGLDRDQQKKFMSWMKTGDANLIAGNAYLMDLAIDTFDYEHPDQKVAKSPDLQVKRQALLVARAKLGIRSDELKIEPDQNNKPDLGHPSSRIEWSAGQDNLLGSFGDLDVRFALHDLLDPQRGYPPASVIEFMNFRARTYLGVADSALDRSHDRSLIQFQSFDFFNMEARTPRTDFEQPFSWKARLGAHRITDFSCIDCLAYGAGFGFGASWSLNKSGSSLVSFLLEGDGLVSGGFHSGSFRTAIGPSAILRFGLGPKASGMIGMLEQTLISGHPEALLNVSSELRYHAFQELSLGLKYSTSSFSHLIENQGILSFYYFL